VPKRVTSITGSNSVKLSGRSRFFAVFVGAGLLALLLVASRLRPDPRGWGTHEQLGLPPCTFSQLAGVRCPACGMTTSWSLVVHGRLTEALDNHVTGTALAALAMLGAVAALWVAASGRWIVWRRYETMVAVAATSASGLILIEWMIRLLAK
jgi:hypothetical protein